MRTRFTSWMKLFPALVWVFVQLWMSVTVVHGASHVADGATHSLQISVILCGGDGPVTLDLGGESPDPSPISGFHACDWCKSFGVTTLPSPGAVYDPIVLFDGARLHCAGPAHGECQTPAASYLSRAPPV